MTFRMARLDIEAVLVPETQVDFGTVSAASAGAESSLFSLLKLKSCSDEDLAEQLKRGDGDALAVLFRRHGPLLFGIARRILRSDSEAEDAVQQIFLDVFRSIRQFDSEKGTFKRWLLMFAYQRIFNSRRSQRANRFFDTDPFDEDLSGPLSSERGRSTAENNVLVAQVLSSLQSRQRRTIELVYYEGLTAEEVASKTGESVQVVRHNLYRGLDKLRKAFRAGTMRPETKEG